MSPHLSTASRWLRSAKSAGVQTCCGPAVICASALASKPLAHKAVAPERLVGFDPGAQLIRCEAGLALDVTRHVRLVGKSGFGRETGQLQTLATIEHADFVGTLGQYALSQSTQRLPRPRPDAPLDLPEASTGSRRCCTHSQRARPVL